MKLTEIVVVSLRGGEGRGSSHGICSRVSCSGQNNNISCCHGIFKGCTRRNSKKPSHCYGVLSRLERNYLNVLRRPRYILSGHINF